MDRTTSPAPRDTPRLLIVNGLSASGKSTLGTEIAASFGLPFFSKDTFKEIMFDHLGWSDSFWADKLGAAATEILWSVAASELSVGRSLVIESNFRAGFADAHLAACRAERTVHAVELHRALSGERHPGHGERAVDELYAQKIPELRRAHDRMLSTTDAYLIVDTTDPNSVDREDVTTRLRALLWPDMEPRD
jgi:predicted kinase